MEVISNWVRYLFLSLVGVLATWIGWRSTRTKKGIQTDEDNQIADVAGKMVNVIQTVNKPLMDDIARIRTEFKELSDKYIALSIQVGVLKAQLDIKDQKIKELELENSHLKSQLNGHYKPIKGSNSLS